MHLTSLRGKESEETTPETVVDFATPKKPAMGMQTRRRRKQEPRTSAEKNTFPQSQINRCVLLDTTPDFSICSSYAEWNRPYLMKNNNRNGLNRRMCKYQVFLQKQM